MMGLLSICDHGATEPVRKVLIPTDLWGGKYCVFGVYEDLVFSVAKRVPRRIISGLCGAKCRYGALFCPLVRSSAKTTRRGLSDARSRRATQGARSIPGGRQ